MMDDLKVRACEESSTAENENNNNNSLVSPTSASHKAPHLALKAMQMQVLDLERNILQVS